MIKLPPPDLQIEFSRTLREIRTLYLQDALLATVSKLSIRELDRQLDSRVPESFLAALAQHGLRGELMFPVPLLLEAEPRLLGYYRLLYGFSQKDFYGGKFGISRFKSMEAKGILTATNANQLGDLCGPMIEAGGALIKGIGAGRISKTLLDDLTLLTLGPQLRGGANVRKGSDAITVVFGEIAHILKKDITNSVSNKIEIENAAGRYVAIEFAPDPDIIIREEIGELSTRNIVAIEVKGGTDYSNIHNRIGEAEKSHQKARRAGYVECWTVINVENLDIAKAHGESPSTDRFFNIGKIVKRSGPEYTDFRNRIISLTGIRDSG